MLAIAGTSLVTSGLKQHVGLDRLRLGVHTLTDVVAGYTLGLGVGLLAACVVDPVARVGAGVDAPG